jgi:hypothetical protein
MKKLALLATVLLTTSCAVGEETTSETTDLQVTENQPSQQDESDNPEESANDSLANDPNQSSETSDSPTSEPEVENNELTESGASTDSESNQEENGSSSDSLADPADTTPPSAETVNSYIDLLRVAPEVTSGYDRDLFRHWVDADGDGCHAREETLIAESVGSVSVTSDCDIQGSWFSAFDGETTTNTSNFDVDHMVPLKEAWDSGANGWDSSTRERFANDLGSPHSLIAVSRGSNRSKGAKDPAEWMPSRQSYTCEYIFTWTLVKIRWSLSADPAEINALRNLGGDCLVADMNFSPAVSEAEIIAGDPPEPEPEPQPIPSADGELDPRFSSCRAAKAEYYGPYVDGVDPEYDWYRDGDSDGTVCE